jgi:Tol biopolymer transport system component
MRYDRLTYSGDVTLAEVSPDGRMLAQVTDLKGHQSLWLQQVAMGSRVQLTPADQVEYWALRFSPDGRHVYYVAWRADQTDAALYRLPILGGAAMRVLGGIGSDFDFSPDGRRLAYVDDRSSQGVSRLMVAGADGSNPRPLATRHHPSYFGNYQSGPAWAPDGRRIACPVGSHAPEEPLMRIVLVSVPGGLEQAWSNQTWADIEMIEWLPDGSGVVLVASMTASDAHQLWFLAYPGGQVRRVSNDLSDYDGISVSADGSELVSVRSEAESTLWITDGDATAPGRMISSEVSGTKHGEVFAWTRDGRLIYGSGAGGNRDLWIVRADGSEARQLTDDPCIDRDPALSPDGRTLAYACNRGGAFHIWTMDLEGGEPVQLTRGSIEVRPQFSSDGRWLVYQQGLGWMKDTIWKVPAGGGRQVQIHAGVSLWPVPAPDQPRVAFYAMDSTEWTLRVMPLDGAGAAGELPFPSTVSERVVRWTPDGTALVMIDNREGVSNLLAQPLSGAPAYPMTHFTGGVVKYFAWSPDGERLAYSRSRQTSDAVRLRDFR